MKKLLAHRKLLIGSLIVFLLAGLGPYFYFSHQQNELDQTTQTVQQSAVKAMRKKEKQQEKTSSDQNLSSSSAPVVNSENEKALRVKSKNQPDYEGKDVKPLTLKAMRKVNAEKVVSSFGVGTIEIPSIGMNLPILEGMSQENLSVGAGTMKPNQELGKGNFTLAGHYMTNAGLLFGGIKNVKQNDSVQVTYKNKTMNFKVTTVKHITAEDNQVIFDSEGNGILTLITCDSSVAGTDGRLMVRAVLSQ